MSTCIHKPSARCVEAEAADPTIFIKPSRIPVPQKNVEATSEDTPPKKRSRVTIEDKEDKEADILRDMPPLKEVSDEEDKGNEGRANPIDVDLVDKRKQLTLGD